MAQCLKFHMANNKAKTYRSPLRYPGGKACIFKFMTKLLEDNNLIGINYAEPYAGGAGLALRLMMEEYVGDIFINDLDPSIYAFWYAVLNNNDDFCEWIENVPVTTEQWYKCKEIQANYKTIDTYDLAKSTFFLNRTNISGVISGGMIGGSTQTGKFKIDARFCKSDLIKKIQDIKNFIPRIHLSNSDGIEFVKAIDRKKQDIFIYLDPPYYKKGSLLYMNAFKDNDHKALSNFIKGIRKRWMISYDNQDFIKDIYKKNRMVKYQLSQCASNRVGDEILIFDDRINYKNAIGELKNAIEIY